MVGALAAVLAYGVSSGSGALPSGFQESTAFTGLTNPTAIEFASDGRVFVAEKRGVIKVFDNLSDATPTVFADLNANVYNFWDRGLLGMALDPNFPTSPYVYVLYAYDWDPSVPNDVPRWGTDGVYSDPCPTPPGATADGCVVTGRLSRLTASGNTMSGSEQVLLTDWCRATPPARSPSDPTASCTYREVTGRASTSPTTGRTERRSTRVAIHPAAAWRRRRRKAAHCEVRTC
jgi:Glucose / Sorbosone dehydrogenase